ncbi:MAG: ABC transporter permease subunit [Euryarchaeota archaeon]|nr:ABC transporter permease subunit [Euryarchaeota archaeon]
MAVEGGFGKPTSGILSRRMRERVLLWRRLFIANWNLFKASRIGVVGLAIMIAFVLLALAAPFMGLRDPIRWTAPDEDLIEVASFWTKDNRTGSEIQTALPFDQPVAFRMGPREFDVRADRIYVAGGNRLYALFGEPGRRGENAWGTFQFFNVAGDGIPRRISVPPIAMNFGNFDREPPDYELHVGTDDGAVFILRDSGPVVPSGTNVARVNLDAAVTGMAAFTGDMEAPAAVLGSPAVTWFNGTAWVTRVVPGFGDARGDAGLYASLGLDSSDGVHLGFLSLRDGAPRVASLAGDTWTIRSPEPFSTSVNLGPYVSLAIGADGNPRVAYYDESEADLKFAHWTGTAFDVTYVDFGGDVGRYASLALEAGTDLPRIAYYSAADTSLKFASFDGASWTFETVAPMADPDVAAPPAALRGRLISLAIDGVGVPHIAYHDALLGTVNYVRKVGPTWAPPVTVDAGGVGAFASLALDSVGQPTIAYYDSGNQDLKVASFTGVWTTSTVDAAGDVGMYASLAFNLTDVPYISYHDATNLDLKLARWNETASAWDTETIVSQGFVGLHTSLTFDSVDRPVIGFYTMTVGRTTRDILVAGTAAGSVYGIEVGVPRTVQRTTGDPRSQRVVEWDYRIRWSVDLGSEVHVAGAPLNTVTNVPLYSPAFNENGTAVFVGTLDGRLVALRTEDGQPYWSDVVDVGDPWRTAPVVQRAAEGPLAGREIVYAASSRLLHDFDGDGDEEVQSLVIARLADTGEPLPQWIATFQLRDFEGAAPVGPTLTTPDGGDLSQPTVEGGTIYVGSTSGQLYAIRRDAVGGSATGGGLAAASLKWVYRDNTTLGLDPEFASPPVVISERGILLTAANHNNGTAADPTDDLGLLYSFKIDGVLSWKKTLPGRIAGMPSSWEPPASLGPNVWVSFAGETVTGVSALSSIGRFLAPSEPSWVRPYPSGNQYWLGLDSQGRDIFSQVIWGSRIALLVGFLSAFFTVLIGVMVGLIAGYVGGKVEAVLMRFTDVILVLPGLPLIITLAAVLGASIWNIILVISLLGWPGIARIIRAEVLSLKERPFIDSARVSGASTTRIVFRHIAPNVMPLAFLYMTFSVSGAILTEAALSFIGLGDINTMSWGIMLQLVSQSKALTAWWWLLPPGVAITLISLAFFLVGRAFDEIVNPRLRKR